LLAGSSAINAGDNNRIPPDTFDLDGDGVSEQLPFDQRGVGFVRVSGGTVDIGAVEAPSPGDSADFDADGDADGNDFLIWQRGVGRTGAQATQSAGNADGDSDVDSHDLDVWRSQFGSAQVAALPAAAALEASRPAMTMAKEFKKPPILPSLAVDAAMEESFVPSSTWRRHFRLVGARQR
jgi:hypothetical protein